MLSGKHWRVRVVNTIAPDRVVHLKVVAASHIEVFQTMGRRRVDTARAGVSGHVLTQHDGHRRLVEWRSKKQAF